VGGSEIRSTTATKLAAKSQFFMGCEVWRVLDYGLPLDQRQ
jgi:hypothetical protein